MSSTDKVNVPGDVLSRIRSLSVSLEKFISSSIQIPEELNFSEVLVLAQMAAVGSTTVSISISVLKNICTQSKGSIAEVCRSLQRRGYLSGRSISSSGIRLTQKGLDLGSQVARFLKHLDKNIGNVLPADRFILANDFMENKS